MSILSKSLVYYQPSRLIGFHRPSFICTVAAFTLGLCSCSDNQSINKAALADTVKIKTVQESVPRSQKPDTADLLSIRDTIKRFIVDDYPLTNDMLGWSPRNITSGNIVSSDKVWFTNDSLKETIVVEVYTDHFRMEEFHFQDATVPKALIRRMELHTADGELASKQLKQKYFKGFLPAASKIDSRYFTTYKGFKLGDGKQKVIDIYGIPDKKSVEDGIEVLEWDFVGDILYDAKIKLNGKPLAKDNYGHQATMMFKKDKLIAMILHNDAP